MEALEIVFRANSAAVEGLVDRNGHRRKDVGEGENVSWGGARTIGEGCECEITKNMFFQSDLLQLCLQKNGKSLSSSLTHNNNIINIVSNIKVIEPVAPL